MCHLSLTVYTKTRARTHARSVVSLLRSARARVSCVVRVRVSFVLPLVGWAGWAPPPPPSPTRVRLYVCPRRAKIEWARARAPAAVNPSVARTVHPKSGRPETPLKGVCSRIRIIARPCSRTGRCIVERSGCIVQTDDGDSFWFEINARAFGLALYVCVSLWMDRNSIVCLCVCWKIRAIVTA